MFNFTRRAVNLEKVWGCLKRMVKPPVPRRQFRCACPGSLASFAAYEVKEENDESVALHLG